MSERYIVIPGWDTFQHRDAARALVPTWIKVYTELMAKEEFLELSFHMRGVLVSLWLEYAASKRQLRDNTVTLTRRLGHRVTRPDLDRLSRAGFLTFSASMPASNHASLEKKREEKRSLLRDQRSASTATAEREIHRTENGRGNGWIDNLGQYTGCRYVRGEFAITAKYDPLGTEPPPQNWPHERPTRDEIRKALAEQDEVDVLA